MDILSKLRRLKPALKAGDYNAINVSQINYGECFKNKMF